MAVAVCRFWPIKTSRASATEISDQDTIALLQRQARWEAFYRNGGLPSPIPHDFSPPSLLAKTLVPSQILCSRALAASAGTPWKQTRM